MTRIYFVLAAVAICLMGVSESIQAQSVYVALENQQFGEVNLSTGAYTEIGVLPFLPNSLTFAANGSLYAGDLSADNLWQINPGTAASTLVGNIGFEAYGLAGVSNGTVYAVTGDLDPNGVYTINTSTASPTEVGTTGVNGIDMNGTLAADSSDNLYMTLGAGGDGFYQVNGATGTATFVGDTGIAGFVYGLAWANSSMYALDVSGDIYTINLSTGAGTNTGVVASTGADIYAVAPIFVPAIGAPTGTPEPSAAVYAVSLLALLGAAIRKRRQISR